MGHRVAALVVTFSALASGCSSPVQPNRISTAVEIHTAAQSGLSAPAPDDSLKSVIVPPLGWTAEPPKASDKRRHQIWFSPSKNTAYGIIYFKMPFPVGQGIAFNGFIDEMKKSEGEATVVSRVNDDKLPGIRFEARGTVYDIRGNMVVDGWHGWVVYAGTVIGKPIDEKDLKTAIDARDQTRVDLP